MKGFFSRSFRNRLTAAFLAVSLVPLLLCSAMLLQLFRLRMTNDAQKDAEERLDRVGVLLDETCRQILETADALQQDQVLLSALEKGGAEETVVYSRLLEAAQGAGDIRYDLYDETGKWLGATRSVPKGADLPTNWGLLRSAQAGALCFLPPADDTGTDASLLQGAVLLTDGAGDRVGYLTAGLSRSDLERLLGGAVGARGELLLLSAYWRPIYCTQPALADSLAASLRQRLLEGEPLNSGDAEFTYTVAEHQETGLYLVLR